MTELLNIYSSYLKDFIAIAFAHLLAVISPGPDFIVVLKQCNAKGRKSAFLTSLGIALGIVVHVFYCIVGIGYLILKTPFLFSLIKIIGAVYLFYIGFISFYNTYNKKKNFSIKETPSKKNDVSSFYLGFITNVFNPKATLFFLSVFSLLIGETTPLSIKIFYGMWMSIVTGLWFCIVSFLFTSKFSEIFISKYAHIIDKIMGIVLMVISIKLILY